MRFLRFVLVPALLLLAGASASAQPDGYVTGAYRISMTVDGIRYRLPASGYSISTAIVQDDTVGVLNIWITTADAQQGGLPPGPMLKGKQATDIRFFKETEADLYQKIVWTEFTISSGESDTGGDGNSGVTLQLIAEPEFVMLAVPVAGSPAPVLTKVLVFAGPATALMGDD
jgi:hypothetical protein